MSFRRKEVLPGPHKVDPSSYSVDFCPKPLRKRTPPKVREGNILNSYPGNVLYPYKLPEEVRELHSYGKYYFYLIDGKMLAHGRLF